MTVIKTVVSVELDRDWIDLILVTAFDYAEGSANHWLVDEDVERIGDFRGIEPYQNDSFWYAVNIKGSEGNIVIGGSMLNTAVAEIINNGDWVGTETEQQLLTAFATPEDLPDLDGEACDVIVQMAMFGEVIYS